MCVLECNNSLFLTYFISLFSESLYTVVTRISIILSTERFQHSIAL